MRLADARLPFQKQSLPHHRKSLGESARLRDRLFERLVVSGEVLERTVLVALRDVGVRQMLAPDVLAPAVATDDAADAVCFVLANGLPTRAVAEWTRHRGDCIRVCRTFFCGSGGFLARGLCGVARGRLRADEIGRRRLDERGREALLPVAHPARHLAFDVLHELVDLV